MSTHTRRSRILLHASILLVSVVMLVLASDGFADTFTVTGPDDPVPNSCLPGDCSLREAIAAANGNANTDVIQVPAGNYILTRGKLTITGGVQIHGAGATTVEGDGTFPLFDIVGTTSVMLSNLAIRAHGAHAVDSDKRADTILEFVTIPDVDSEVWVGDTAGDSTGSFELRHSQTHSYIACDAVVACRITDSTIQRLQSGVNDLTHTNVEILRSTVDGDGNASLSGVFIVTQGAVTLADTTIRNTASGLVVSAYTFATPSSVLLDHLTYVGNSRPLIVAVPTSVTVVDSDFSDNVACVCGAYPGAIEANAASDWDISGSTFTSNIGNTNLGSAPIGGAVLVKGAAHMAIRNSTFSGNSFSAAVANGARGAAIGYVANSGGTSLLLQHVTIVPPAFAPAGILGTAIGGTGGESGLALTVLNSILRGTCSLDADAMDFNFGNIESPGDTCDLNHASNLVNVSSSALALGALGDHGGVTMTHEPAAGSVAIDNGSTPQCLTVDQRGYARPAGLRCDVGAVEVGAIDDTIFANGFD